MNMSHTFIIGKIWSMNVHSSLMRLRYWLWVQASIGESDLGIIVEELVGECLGEQGYKLFASNEADNVEGDIQNTINQDADNVELEDDYSLRMENSS